MQSAALKSLMHDKEEIAKEAAKEIRDAAMAGVNYVLSHALLLPADDAMPCICAVCTPHHPVLSIN